MTDTPTSNLPVNDVAATALPQRPLGRTGEKVPILGLGSAPGGFGLPDAAAIELYEDAIDQGITYIDTAPGYERAQTQLGHILPRRRDELFVATKVATSNGAEAVKILEENLRDLRTDAVDLTYVHSMGHQDPTRVLAPDGALAGLRQAQKRGLTRFIGFTAHHLPAHSLRLLQESEVDVIMVALNFADRFTYDFEGKILPLARQSGVGIAAMKVYGGAPQMEYHKPIGSVLSDSGFDDHEMALRYALSLPDVALAVVGVYNHEEVRRNVEWARRFTPLSPTETTVLAAKGQALAQRWGDHFGPVEPKDAAAVPPPTK
jgi:uncharacterized protein